MTKQQAKQNIQKLISDYESLKQTTKLDQNEQFTKDRFIRPLFEALGWDFRQDVWPEEQVSKGRVDYAFRIGDFNKFFVEAKKFSVDLEQPQWAEQVVEYAWNKSVTWAVLTDFEGIKIFNSEWKEKPYRAIKDITYNQYLSRFNELWLLSKESIEKGELDTKAEEWGVKAKKEQVTEQLARDMNEWRELFTQEIHEWNKDKYSKEEIDEAVQRFLDRLIFIRYVEDKELEPKMLEPLLRDFKSKPGDGNIIPKLNEVFHKFDRWYDSRLFEKHFSEEMEGYSGKVEKIIEGLYYSKETSHPYDFSAIGADVLGSVYEQYLGYLQKKGNNNGGKSKRKEQGIYYTPTYIVDYIVQNTVGQLIKDKPKEDVKKLKILDPACGSGSFLIRAYEVLEKYYQKYDQPVYDKSSKLGKIEQTLKDKRLVNTVNAVQKANILRDNLYGVDLDPKAVEIAQLNLLLKAITQRTKLPNLSNRIKCGNSLIDKGDKKFKPFKYQKEFEEVFKQDGFDVVIGNPPYLKEMDNKNIFEPIKKSSYQKYYQGKMDLWYFFLHRAIDIVKENGLIGFITNSYFLKSVGASKLIDRIKDQLVLVKTVNLGDIKVFGDVSGKHLIHIYQKRATRDSDKTILINVSDKNFTNLINENNKKEVLYKNLITDSKINLESTEDLNLKLYTPLGDIYDVSQGVVEATDKISKKQAVSSDKFKPGDGVFVLSKQEIEKMDLSNNEKKVIKRYLNTNNIGKYYISFGDEFLIYSDKETREGISRGLYPNIKNHLDRMKKFITSSNKPYGLHRPRENRYFENPKLICKGMFATPEFCFDENKYYVGFSFSVIIQKQNNYSLKYLLGILNSQFGNFWFNRNGKKRGVGVDIGVAVFRQFPVHQADSKQQKPIITLVDRVMKLKKELNSSPKHSDRWYLLDTEIKKVEKEIDELVYKQYGFTEGEIKIIENNGRK